MFSVHVTLFTTDLVFYLFLVYLGLTWLFSRNTINIERPIAGGVQLWFRKDCWTLLRQITSPPVAVARYNSLAAYRLLGFYSRKGCTLGTSSSCACLVPKIVQISSTSLSRSWCKCMRASPDNRSSDILFLRYDLIRCKPENEQPASAELTGRVQPIISKTRMLAYNDILISIF